MTAPTVSLISLRRVRGAALILLLLLLSMAMLALQLRMPTPAGMQALKRQHTSAALAAAKQALIGYALNYADTHPEKYYGLLPCPDTTLTSTDGEGWQATCGSKNVSVLGRLPWHRLNLSALRDGDGECLWYAVSGTYKNNPKTDDFSPATASLLEVYAEGNQQLGMPDDPVVAVIIAPGPPLPGQQRTPNGEAKICGGNYFADNYLDQDTKAGIDNAQPSSSANAISRFSAAAYAQSGGFNDQLLVITRREVFAGVCRLYASQLFLPCDDGSGQPTAACKRASDILGDHCEAASCGMPAEVLISANCLQDKAASVCKQALLNLQGCGDA